MSPDILVIVVTYNSVKYVEACLRPLLNEPNLSIVVVDNASGDRTVEVVRRLQVLNPHMINIVARPMNAGFSASCNLAIRKFRKAEQAVLLLNPDCVLPAHGLWRLRQLVTQPSVGIATLRIEKPTGELDTACARRLPDLAHSVRHAFKFLSSKPTAGYNVRPANRGEIVGLEATVGALMLLSSELIGRIGLLDEAFWMYGEDLDLCKRAHDAGFLILQAGDPVAIHVKGASSGSTRSLGTNCAFHRSLWIYYKKHLAHNHTRVSQYAVLLGIGFRLIMSVLRGVVRAKFSKSDRNGGSGIS